MKKLYLLENTLYLVPGFAEKYFIAANPSAKLRTYEVSLSEKIKAEKRYHEKFVKG